GVPAISNLTTAPFVKIANGYYYFDLGEQKNWYEAYHACRRMDAELVTFETLEEWQTINKYALEHNLTKIFWTSATDQGHEGVYIWFTNGQTIVGGMWRIGNPDNRDNKENCIEYRPTHGVNDYVCDHKNNFICEAVQPKTASFVIW
ncbi:CG43055, partial [Drosophila busckii]